MLRSADEHTETPGKMIIHEVTEAYEGARISQKTGISSPPANIAGSDFLKAHNKATSQSIVYQKMYDKMGEETQDINNAVKVEWFVSKRGINKIIQILP